MYAIQSTYIMAITRIISISTHALSMVVAGTALDVSYLIDFLPSYLFPNGERQISQWLLAGKSLGGHATWIGLTHGESTCSIQRALLIDTIIFLMCSESRISLAVPIIACPDYMKLMTKRAKYSHVELAPPHFPDSLRQYIAKNDPAQAPYTASDSSNPFWGKKVLVLSGADDPLVPWVHSEEFVENLKVGPNGIKEVVVAPGVGHECTPEMVKQMSSFIWEHSLRSKA